MNLADKTRNATIVEEKLYDAANDEEYSASYGNYLTYSIKNSEKFFIVANTHAYGGERWPYVLFLDNNGNHLHSIYELAGTAKTIKFLPCEVPDGAKTLIVNGQMNDGLPMVYTTSDQFGAGTQWTPNTIRSICAEMQSTYDSEERLWDADQAEINTVYRLHVNDGEAPAIDHLPFTRSPSQIMLYLITIGRSTGANAYRCQLLLSDTGIMWTRVSGNDGYFRWILAAGGLREITITPSDDVIQKFMDAISFGAKDVYINSGDYDVISLFKSHFGNGYFDDYQEWYNPITGDMNFGRGIVLSKGIHYHFSSNAFFHGDYSGSNQNVKTYFSLFSVERGNGGAVIDGLNITECDNIRYAIHDDFQAGADGSGIVRYTGCVFHSTRQSLGMGGRNGGITIIENCIFDEETASFIHTPNTQGETCRLIYAGNYSNMPFYLNRGATNTAKSEAYAHGNKNGGITVSNDSWNLTEFNNELNE